MTAPRLATSARLALLSAFCDVATAVRAQFIGRPGDTFDDEDVVRAAERAADLARALGVILARDDGAEVVVRLDTDAIAERLKQPEIARMLVRLLLSAAGKNRPETP